jgi:DNA replication protein DnaC
MEHDAQLKIQLKRLKLSGIPDTLDLRLLESQQNQLDYKSFLSLVLQDELEARQMRKVKRLLRRAHFGHEQTLEGFDFSLTPALNATLVRELATRRFLERGEGVILIPPCGKPARRIWPKRSAMLLVGTITPFTFPNSIACLWISPKPI